jgi:phage terminase small subunit
MASKKNTLKTISDLTLKQRKFVDILASNWGNITKADACIEAGYTTKTEVNHMKPRAN